MNKIPKLNLIPILDAVFIFIFFLLMSAQFVDIYEIGTDAPTVSEIEPSKDKTPPLNLTLIITSEKITIQKGLNQTVVDSIKKIGKDYDYKKLKLSLKKIKIHNIDEVTIILKPLKSISYEKIVMIMDTVRGVDPTDAPIVAKNKKGKTIQTRDLFNQVIFETII